MTFGPELMRMLTSIMVTTFALILKMVNALISAVHLAEALWKQLRMYKVSFRCNCLCDRQGLAVLPNLIYNGFKNY